MQKSPHAENKPLSKRSSYFSLITLIFLGSVSFAVAASAESSFSNRKLFSNEADKRPSMARSGSLERSHHSHDSSIEVADTTDDPCPLSTATANPTSPNRPHTPFTPDERAARKVFLQVAAAMKAQQTFHTVSSIASTYYDLVNDRVQRIITITPTNTVEQIFTKTYTLIKMSGQPWRLISHELRSIDAPFLELPLAIQLTAKSGEYVERGYSEEGFATFKFTEICDFSPSTLLLTQCRRSGKDIASDDAYDFVETFDSYGVEAHFDTPDPLPSPDPKATATAFDCFDRRD